MVIMASSSIVRPINWIEIGASLNLSASSKRNDISAQRQSEKASLTEVVVAFVHFSEERMGRSFDI